MKLFKTTSLAVAALATLTVGVAPAFARPHNKPHKVCKMERHHGHAKRVCHWVR